jgi:hypothetical protein
LGQDQFFQDPSASTQGADADGVSEAVGFFKSPSDAEALIEGWPAKYRSTKTVDIDAAVMTAANINIPCRNFGRVMRPPRFSFKDLTIGPP